MQRCNRERGAERDAAKREGGGGGEGRGEGGGKEEEYEQQQEEERRIEILFMHRMCSKTESE